MHQLHIAGTVSDINLNNNLNQFVISGDIYAVSLLPFLSPPPDPRTLTTQFKGYTPFKFICEFPAISRWTKTPVPKAGMSVIVNGTIHRQILTGVGAGMFVVQVSQFVYSSTARSSTSFVSPGQTPNRRRQPPAMVSTYPPDGVSLTPEAGPGPGTQAAAAENAAHVAAVLGEEPSSPSPGGARSKRPRN